MNICSSPNNDHHPPFVVGSTIKPNQLVHHDDNTSVTTTNSSSFESDMLVMASPTDLDLRSSSSNSNNRKRRIGKKFRGVFSFSTATNNNTNIYSKRDTTNSRDNKPLSQLCATATETETDIVNRDPNNEKGCSPRKVVVDIQLLQQEQEEANCGTGNQHSEGEVDDTEKCEYGDMLSPLPPSHRLPSSVVMDSSLSQDSLTKEIEEMQDVMDQLKKALQFDPLEITPTIPSKKSILSVTTLPKSPTLDCSVSSVDNVEGQQSIQSSRRRTSWADYAVPLDGSQSDQFSCDIHEEEEPQQSVQGCDLITKQRNYNSWSIDSFSHNIQDIPQQKQQQQQRLLTPKQKQRQNKIVMMKRQAKLSLIAETKQIEERLAMLKAKKAERIARAARARRRATMS